MIQEKVAPLTNLQIEIIKVYKAELNEKELLEVSGLLSAYLTARAIKLADEHGMKGIGMRKK